MKRILIAVLALGSTLWSKAEANIGSYSSEVDAQPELEDGAVLSFIVVTDANGVQTLMPIGAQGSNAIVVDPSQLNETVSQMGSWTETGK